MFLPQAVGFNFLEKNLYVRDLGEIAYANVGVGFATKLFLGSSVDIVKQASTWVWNEKIDQMERSQLPIGAIRAVGWEEELVSTEKAIYANLDVEVDMMVFISTLLVQFYSSRAHEELQLWSLEMLARTYWKDLMDWDADTAKLSSIGSGSSRAPPPLNFNFAEKSAALAIRKEYEEAPQVVIESVDMQYKYYLKEVGIKIANHKGRNFKSLFNKKMAKCRKQFDNKSHSVPKRKTDETSSQAGGSKKERLQNH